MEGAKGRILTYAKYKNLSARAIAATLNLSTGYFSAPGSVSSDILSLICTKYPDVNLYWIVTGTGEMILNQYLPDEYVPRQLSNPEDTQDIINLRMPVEDTLNILRNKITILLQEMDIKDKIIARLKEMVVQSQSNQRS
jgi:hypothetical protein